MSRSYLFAVDRQAPPERGLRESGLRGHRPQQRLVSGHCNGPVLTDPWPVSVLCAIALLSRLQRHFLLYSLLCRGPGCEQPLPIRCVFPNTWAPRGLARWLADTFGSAPSMRTVSPSSSVLRPSSGASFCESPTDQGQPQGLGPFRSVLICDHPAQLPSALAKATPPASRFVAELCGCVSMETPLRVSFLRSFIGNQAKLGWKRGTGGASD